MARQVMDMQNDNLGKLFEKTNSNFDEIYKKNSEQDSSLAAKAEKSKVDNIEARLDNLTANSGAATEGNAELIDLRVGADGETYETAGKAIRSQISALENASIDRSDRLIAELSLHYHNQATELKDSFQLGKTFNLTSGVISIVDSNIRFINSDFLEIPSTLNLRIRLSPLYKYRIYYFEEDSLDSYISNTDWLSTGANLNLSLNTNAKYIRLVVSKVDESEVSNTDITNSIFIFYDKEDSEHLAIIKPLNYLLVGYVLLENNETLYSNTARAVSQKVRIKKNSYIGFFADDKYYFAVDKFGDNKVEYISSEDNRNWRQVPTLIEDEGYYNLIFRAKDHHTLNEDDKIEILSNFLEVPKELKDLIDNSLVMHPLAYLKLGTFTADDLSHPSDTRCCILNVHLNADSLVCFSNSVVDYDFALDINSDNKLEYVSDTGSAWISDYARIPSTGYYNLLFRRKDNTDIKDSDIATILDSFIELRYLGILSNLIRNRNSSPLANKKILAIGDSFIDYNTQGLGNDLLSIIADRCSMTQYNYGLSSSSLAYDSNQTVLSVMDRYEDMLDEVAEVDYIIVLAGHNDSNPELHGGSAIPIGADSDDTNNTFKGALNILIPALITKYPLARILFLTPFNRRGVELPYATAMEEVCAKYSVPCFNNYKASGICFQNAAQKAYFDLNNTLHLTKLGNEYMANKYIHILESM